MREKFKGWVEFALCLLDILKILMQRKFGHRSIDTTVRVEVFNEIHGQADMICSRAHVKVSAQLWSVCIYNGVHIALYRYLQISSNKVALVSSSLPLYGLPCALIREPQHHKYFRIAFCSLGDYSVCVYVLCKCKFYISSTFMQLYLHPYIYLHSSSIIL